MKKIILLLSFLITVPALSQECGNTDLRSNQLMGTVRDQGHLGWCFAYVAGDMYSVALGKRVSPFDIAVNYYRFLANNFNIRKGGKMLTQHVGGRQDWVYETVTRTGICPDNVFSAYQQQSVDGLTRLDRLVTEVQPLTVPERQDVVTRRLYPQYHDVYRVFPMTPAPQLRNAIVENDAITYPIAGLADQICAGKRIPVRNIQRQSHVGRHGQDSVYTFLNKHLSKGRPVAIGYDAGVLRSAQMSDKGVSHISTIVGSRVVSGKCEYLLRNSWGTGSVTSIHQSFQKKKAGDHVWLPATFVRDMARELHVLVRIR